VEAILCFLSVEPLAIFLVSDAIYYIINSFAFVNPL
jgi:hypothetical protein